MFLTMRAKPTAILGQLNSANCSRIESSCEVEKAANSNRPSSSSLSSSSTSSENLLCHSARIPLAASCVQSIVWVL